MVEYWYPTPIYYSVVNNIEQVQKDIGEVLESCEFSKHPEWGNTNHSLTDPSFEESFLDKHQLTAVKKELEWHIQQYLSEFSNDVYDIIFKENWLTSTKPKEHATVHNHAGSDISGVYYYQTNGRDGNIYFHNPSMPISHARWMNQPDSIYYTPHVGKIMLFPSWLYHGVRPNETDSTRISLSFNVDIKKRK